jgi:glycosyltransferase involved in cell wall biosynthesis
LFKSTKVVVLPYTDATQSGVAAIALAHGIPVVASAVGGIPEVVIEGRTGLLVPPCDPLALSRAIGQLLRDEQKTQELGRSAAEFARQHLSWTKIASATTKVYEAVVRQRAMGERQRA